MSGIEVVGLVLGSLPLLISAAEHYQKGLEPFKDWWDFRKHLRSFVKGVKAQQRIFHMTLERFLRSINIEDNEIKRLMEDLNYEGWQRPDLQSQIGSRLGPSLGVFMDTINTINGLVIGLEKVLLIENGEVKWLKDSSITWDFQLYRIRRSFSKKGTRAVESLKSQIEILRDLITSNEKLIAQKAKSQAKTWITIFECIRKHASSVHAALRAGWTCQCAPYTASLRLEERKTGDWNSAFNLAFGVPKDQITVRREVTIRIRKEVEVSAIKCNTVGFLESGDNLRHTQPGLNSLCQIFKPKSISHTNTISGLIRSSTNSAVSITLPASVLEGLPINSRTSGTDCVLGEGKIRSKRRPKLKKNVQLDVLTDLPPRSVSTATRQTQLQVAEAVQLAEIKDLCSIIRSTPLIDDCLGYLSDGERMHELRLFPSSEETDEGTFINLEDVLSNQSGVRLSQQKRIKLASILASSLLQLQTTPWLFEKFEKRNIFFYQQQTTIVIDYPYMKHSFSHQGRTSTTLQIDPCSTVRNSLRNFGILLLELCFGQLLEDQEIWKQCPGADGTPHQNADLITGLTWSDMLWEEDPELERIIKHCLYCTFEGKPDWRNEIFTQAVYSNVVGPLDEYFTSKWS